MNRWHSLKFGLESLLKNKKKIKKCHVNILCRCFARCGIDASCPSVSLSCHRTFVFTVNVYHTNFRVNIKHFSRKYLKKEILDNII